MPPYLGRAHPMDTQHVRLHHRIPTASTDSLPLPPNPPSQSLPVTISESSPHHGLCPGPPVSGPAFQHAPSQSSPSPLQEPQNIASLSSPSQPHESSDVLPESSPSSCSSDESRRHRSCRDPSTPPTSKSSNEFERKLSSQFEGPAYQSDDGETSSPPPLLLCLRYHHHRLDALRNGSDGEEKQGEKEFVQEFCGTASTSDIQLSSISCASFGEEKSEQKEKLYEEEERRDGEEDDEGCSTPRAMEFCIPKLSSVCPPAPKKKQSQRSKSRSCQSMPRFHVCRSGSNSSRKQKILRFFMVPDFAAFFPAAISVHNISSSYTTQN